VPVYPEEEAQEFAQKIAKNKGADASAVVDRLLRSDMEMVEAAK